MSAKKKPSARAERRTVEREVKKQIDRKDRLAQLSAGGAPERPISVETAALIEPMARSSHCPRCDGSVRVEDHVARSDAGRTLRVVQVCCVSCSSTRELFFVIQPRVLH